MQGHTAVPQQRKNQRDELISVSLSNVLLLLSSCSCWLSRGEYQPGKPWAALEKTHTGQHGRRTTGWEACCRQPYSEFPQHTSWGHLHCKGAFSLCFLAIEHFLTTFGSVCLPVCLLCRTTQNTEHLLSQTQLPNPRGHISKIHTVSLHLPCRGLHGSRYQYTFLLPSPGSPFTSPVPHTHLLGLPAQWAALLPDIVPRHVQEKSRQRHIENDPEGQTETI